MNYLLDTNILSEIQKGSRCDERVKAWWSQVKFSDLYLSVMVAGEIYRGIEKLMQSNPVRARSYLAWLKSVVHEFDGRVLSIDLEIAAAWGRITTRRTLPLVDGLLAATAIAHDLTLVTRNTKDIEDTGVRYLNPFEEA